MNKKSKLKFYTLDELTDKYIGPKGTDKREQFEFQLKLEVLGEFIKQARRKRKLTQSALNKNVNEE